jgi:hypothetical protein
MARSQALTFTQKIVKHILVNIRTALSVRVGNSAAGHALQAQVIPLPALTAQANRYVAQTIQAPGLRIQQYYKLLPAAKSLGVSVACVTLNALFETMTRKKLHKLAKYCIPSHRANPPFLYWYLTLPSQI